MSDLKTILWILIALIIMALLSHSHAQEQKVYPHGIPQGMECSQHSFRDDKTGQIGPLCSWPEVNEQKKNIQKSQRIGILKISEDYLSDDYSYPNGGAPSPEVIPAPQHMTRGLDDRDYGYTDDMGWHSYPNGTPDPGGNCWASFKC